MVETPFGINRFLLFFLNMHTNERLDDNRIYRKGGHVTQEHVYKW